MAENNYKFSGNNRKLDIKSTFRALSHRNYRLFFGGQLISLIGTWMQRIAMLWLVYSLTGSAFLLGVVGFVGQMPTFLFAPFAGVLADRWNRHRLIIITQALAMLQALIIAVLIFTHTIQFWHILVLSIFLGLVNSFDVPVRQSFVIDIVEDKNDLGNAIALNSSMVNAARLIGPSVAGVIIAATGEGMCFLLNGLSYIAVIVALLFMKIMKKQSTGQKKEIFAEMKDGFVYGYGFPPIKAIILLLALVSLFGMPYTVLMPIFAQKILHGGARELGFLMAAAGIGALVGAFFLASKKSVLGLGKILSFSALTFGIGLITFAFSRNMILSMFLLLITGFGMMVVMATSNTLLQTIVEDKMRGRVMSFYTMAFFGMTPFGSLFAGSLADRIGSPMTVAIGGICCIAGGIFFYRKLPHLRTYIMPIYIQKGIIEPPIIEELPD